MRPWRWEWPLLKRSFEENEEMEMCDLKEFVCFLGLSNFFADLFEWHVELKIG